MTTRTVQLRLQLTGQQAAQQMQRMNLDLSQAQQQQRQNLNQILQTQNRINTSTQQGSKYGQQQLRTGQSMLQTNRLLAQILQQQQRSSSTLNQQLIQQQRSYQLQLNSLRQQVAAAERLRQQLQQAGNAQRDINRSNPGNNRNLIGGAAALAGGGYAAGMIGANYLKEPREIKRQIALITGTLYGGEKMSINERSAKNTETERWVKEAAVNGGSSVSDVVRALNAFAADPAFDKKELKDVLLEASSMAFASGSDAEAVAKSMIATRRFGIKDYKTANDMIFRGGQLGSFEIPDMAQYLPEVLSKAKNQYSNDLDGLRKVTTNLQVAKYTASTSSQAAVNYSNYLGDLDQNHLALQVAKYITPNAKEDIVSAYGVAKKRTGVDFAKSSAKAKLEKGMDQDDYLAYLINREMMNDPTYRKYKQEAKTLKNRISEKRKNGIATTDDEIEWANRMEGAQRIIGQGKFGQILHNAQSGAYYRAKAAYMDEYDSIYSELDPATVKGVKDEEYKQQSANEYAKDGSFDTARDIAKLNNYNSISGWLGDLKQGIADFASSNEGIAAAASAAVVGLTAVGAAGGIAALTMRGGNLAGGAGTGGLLAGGAGTALKVGGQIAVAGVAGYAVGTGIRNMYMQTEAGKNFDDWAGEKIAQVLAAFGNDEARAAVEAQNKYDQMIAQQEQQSKEAASQSQLLMSINNNLMNLANKPQPPLIINGGSLLDSVSSSTQKESNRHGSVPSKPLPGLGG